MRTSSLQLNGVAHRIYSWGSPRLPKLFLVHGWLDTGASFDFLTPYLEKKFHCISLDLRGYGKSAHGKNSLGYFFMEYVADLHALFQKLSPHEPVRVLGHSLGGAVTGCYAGAFPHRVSHFVNVEGFILRGHAPSDAPKKVREWIQSPQPRFKVFKDYAHFARRLIQNNSRLPLDRAHFLAKALCKKVQSGVMMAADPTHLLKEPYLWMNAPTYAFWENITAKCLLVWAEKTEMNQWAKSEDLGKQMQEWFDHFPKESKVEMIADCGHMVHHEKPEELAKLVLGFI